MAMFYNQATLRYGDTTVASNIVTGEILEALTVSKAAVDDNYQPGETLTFVVSAANTSESAYDGVTLTDDLGAYALADGTAVTPLDYVEGSVQVFANGVRQADPTVAATAPLTLSGLTVRGGGSVMILYQAVANEYAPIGAGGQLENTVTLSGGGLIEPVSASAAVPADDQPILSISKALSPVSVSENGRLTYTLILENRGGTEASGDTALTDVFDPALSDLTVTYNGAPWTQGVHYTYDEDTGVFATTAGQITIPAATVSQDEDTGVWSAVPGAATVVVTGSL